MRIALLSAILAACFASVSIAGDAPARHDLSLQFVPESHRLAATDSITLKGPDGKRQVRFRVRKEFAFAESKPPAGLLGESDAEGWRTLDLNAEFKGGSACLTVQYTLTLDRQVKKSGAMAFVAGDETDGYIGPEGLFLPGETGWYPETGGMITCTVTAMLPAPWRIVSQGSRDSERETEIDGTKYIVSAWTQDLPSDGLTISGGVYTSSSIEHAGVVLTTYLFEKHAGMAKELLEATARYLEFYVDLLGPYPYARFDIVENFFTSGYGMPSYTLLGSQVFDVIAMIGLRPGFIDHELVHNWWGNSVYVDYAQGNWCEGATTYCANYFGGREAQDTAEADAYRELVSRKFSISVGTENDYPLHMFRSKKEDFENEIGYGKSSMFFHLLRRTAGDEAFWQAMRSVAAEFRGKTAGWGDFRAALEKASGRNLAAMFDQWLKWKGAPAIRFEGGILDQGARVKGVLTATNSLDPALGYDLEVPLRIRFADGRTTDRLIPVSAGRAEVDICLEGENAAGVEADPEFHVFRRIPKSEILPCLNSTMSQGSAVSLALGEADPGQAQALAWAQESIWKNRKCVKAAEAVAKGGGPFIVLGRPADADWLRKSVTAQGVRFAPESSLDFGVNGGQPWFSVNSTRHAGAESALLVSFMLPSGQSCSILWGNSAEAVSKLRNLFHYGWDQFVVFKSGRALQKGVLRRAEPATATREGAFAKGMVEFLAKATAARKCRPGADSAERKDLQKKLGEMLCEACGGAAEMHEFEFAVPRAGQTAVVRLGGSFASMELSVPVFFPSPPVVEFGGHRLAAAGAEFMHIVHCTEIPKELPGPALVIFRIDGKFGAWTDLVDALENSPEAVKAVILYESAAHGRGERGGFSLADVSEAGAEDAQMRISSFRSRMTKEYSGPICMIAPLVEGSFELSGSVTGKVFLVREEVRIAGTSISARLKGSPVDGNAKETLISAHYDSCGEGFPGADDNASGVACALLAAGLLRDRPLAAPVRVVLFDAEEWGLRGSREWVALNARSTRLVLNVDTIGSREVRKLFVVGSSKYVAVADLVFRFLPVSGFARGSDIDRFAYMHGSDYFPFAEAGVPSAGLFSSSRSVMNSRDDTVDKVDFEKIAGLARLVAGVVEAIAGK